MSEVELQGGQGGQQGHAGEVVVPPPQQHQQLPAIFSPPRTYSGPLWRCVLLLLIILVAGGILCCVGVLGVWVLYHPQYPKLQITYATLNAGFVQELPASGTGLALTADLTVLALVYSNNSKIDLGLLQMDLDITFNGHPIATQEVLPAPVRKPPGDFVLGYVHFVASGVELPREDAEAWTNATVQARPVLLKIHGRFHTKLYIGRWLKYTHWVYRHCSIWVSPPPRGYLRHASCR